MSEEGVADAGGTSSGSRGFFRTFVLPAILFFAIPGFGYWFAGHATSSYDGQFFEMLTSSLDADSLSPDERQATEAFYHDNPPSVLCRAEGELAQALPADYRNAVCGDYAQFRWLGLGSGIALLLGLAALIVMLTCSGLSFLSRSTQYASFVVGWNVMRMVGVAETLLQGAIVVALSFWVTALWFEIYIVKLILVAGALALVACWLVIKAIFARPDMTLPVDGELLDEARARTLWAQLRALCADLGTAPPDQIIAGIDDNFFVTEAPVSHRGTLLAGRTLYVSLSLLKRLEREEADAVLAHEIAHFSGGDTTYSRKLSPTLARYEAYLDALYAGAVSRPIFYFMLLYRGLFQLALSRSQRERELRADAIASERFGPRSMALALLKIAAYSMYRHRIEARLFEQDDAHDEALGIGARVAEGFVQYVQSPDLSGDLRKAEVPHPFDSHPPIEERLAALGIAASADLHGSALSEAPNATWFAEIEGADDFEKVQWAEYEARFREAHELVLAYRYLPQTPEERAHVERYFPAVHFEGSKGLAVSLSCDALGSSTWDVPIPWAAITKLESQDGKVLTVTGAYGGEAKKKLTIKLKKLRDSAAALDAIARYYARYKAAEQYASSQVAVEGRRGP